MPKEGFKSVTLSDGSIESIDNIRQAHEPHITLPGFLVKAAEYYNRRHCPECGAEVTKGKRHTC